MKKYDFNATIKLKLLHLPRNQKGGMIISPFPLAFVRFVVYLQCSTLIHRQTDVCKSRHFLFAYIAVYTI